MRKSLIIIIAAALLVAAVICTAGCVDTKTTDPAVGDWFADDDDTFTMFSLYEDGTGAYLFTKANVSETGEAGYEDDELSTFVWAKNADGTYLLSFADGDKFTAVVNALYGVLTLGDGRVFKKEPSVLSGQVHTQENKKQMLQGWINNYIDKNGEYPPNDLVLQWMEKLGLDSKNSRQNHLNNLVWDYKQKHNGEAPPNALYLQWKEELGL